MQEDLASNSKEENPLELEFFLACERGDLSRVQHLTSIPEVDLNWKRVVVEEDQYGRTTSILVSGFWIACSKGHKEIVELLSKDPRVGVNQPDDEFGMTPFSIACERGHLAVVELLSKDPRVGVDQPRKNGTTPFSIACKRGHLAVVELLSKDPRVDVNSFDYSYIRTPFSFACEWGHLAVVELLSKDPRVDVNLFDYFGESPFYFACMNGNLAVVEFLSKNQRVDVNESDMYGTTPFYLACQEGELDVVELLSKIERVELSREEGTEALWMAVRESRLGMVEEILSRWDVNSERKGESLMERAEEQGDEEIIALLKAYSADPRRTRLLLRMKLGVSESQAAATFALVVFFCDEFFQMRGPEF